MTKTASQKSEPAIPPKRYFTKFSRRYVYGILVVLAVLAVGTFLIKPHYKSLHLASQNQMDDARKHVIAQYFVHSTNCDANDTRSHADRIAEFNKFFKVNKYANRAVIRGCNDSDQLLYLDASGLWLPTEVNITLNTRQNPKWQKECLIDDITTADTVVRPENSSIDANNLSVCTKLRTVSYISVSIHYNF